MIEHPSPATTIEALDRWIMAVNAYPDGSDPSTPEMRQELLDSTDALHTILAKVSILDVKEAFTIRRNLITLTAQFLFNDYSDSDTDAPCDMEYDVYRLMETLHPTFGFDRAAIMPAFVMLTVFTPTHDEYPDLIDEEE